MNLTVEEASELKSKYDTNMRQFAINITERCNMNCSCCYKDSGKLDADITKKIIKKAFTFIDSTWCVTLTGGEPTLRMDLVKYAVNLAKKKHCLTRIATNGLMPEKSLKALLKLKIDVVSIGVNSYHLIDGRVQKTITAFENSKHSKVHINGLENNKVPYSMSSSMFILEDTLSKDGREKTGSKDYDSFSSCNCQGVALWPDGKISPFCRKGHETCYFIDIEHVSKSFIEKYFNKYNRKAYASGVKNLRPYYCEKNLFIDGPIVKRVIKPVSY